MKSVEVECRRRYANNIIVITELDALLYSRLIRPIMRPTRNGLEIRQQMQDEL